MSNVLSWNCSETLCITNMELGPKESSTSLIRVDSTDTSISSSSSSSLDLKAVYSSDTFKDAGNSGKTDEVEHGELNDLLDNASHLFFTIPNNHKSIPRNENNRTVASYVIERQDGREILFTNQVDVLFYDQGRIPINYDVYNQYHHLLFTTDGKEARCGSMSIRIKGEGGVIRGKVESVGFLGYEVMDKYTDQVYSVRIPCWMVLFTCFLYFRYPCLSILRKDISDPTGEIVAHLGYKRWKETVFSSQTKFCIHFLQEIEPDNKLFLLGVTLAFYHMYFKRLGKPLRCFLLYLLFLTSVSLIGISFYLLLQRNLSTS